MVQIENVLGSKAGLAIYDIGFSRKQQHYHQLIRLCIIITISDFVLSASQTLYHHHHIRLKCEQTVRGEGEAQFPKMLQFQHNNNDTHYSNNTHNSSTKKYTHYSKITIHTIQAQYKMLQFQHNNNDTHYSQIIHTIHTTPR